MSTSPGSWILSSVPSSVCLELRRKEGEIFSSLNIPIKRTLSCVLCYERKPICGRAARKVVRANTSCLWKNVPYLLTIYTIVLTTWTNRRIENYFGLNERKEFGFLLWLKVRALGWHEHKELYLVEDTKDVISFIPLLKVTLLIVEDARKQNDEPVTGTSDGGSNRFDKTGDVRIT